MYYAKKLLPLQIKCVTLVRYFRVSTDADFYLTQSVLFVVHT